MSSLREFANTILVFSELRYRANKNHEDWKKAYIMGQRYLSPLQFETVMFLLKENSSNWIHALKSFDTEIFVSANSFAQFIGSMRRAFDVHLFDHSHNDTSHVENCFVLCSLNMAFAAVHAELFELKVARHIVRETITEMRIDYETFQVCTVNPDFDSKRYRSN